MDHRTVERTLFLLIWLVEAGGVSSKKEDAFSKETGSWKSRPTVAYYENNDTTTTQQQPDQRMTTAAQLLDNSTEVAMVTDNSSTGNETTTPSTIMTTSTNSTEDVFASTPSSAAAAAAAANSSSSDAAPNMLTSNASEASSVNNTLPFSASNALNRSNDNASDNFNFLTSTSFTNASTTANIPNSAAAEPDSNATNAVVTNSPNLNNATTLGTDSYNWSTTQGAGGGGGGDGGNGEGGVATGAQESVRAEVDQEGSWNSTTTPPSSDTNNSNSTVQPETDREVNTTTAQALDTTSTASAMPAENSTATSAGPVVNNDTLPFSASNALNHSNDNASENFNFLTSTSFTNANTVANIPNSAAAEPDSNATNAVTNSPNLNNATTLGTDSYNWSTTQVGGEGGDGGNVTGVRVALGAENPFPDDPGSWNSTTIATTIYDSQGNTTQPPGEALPAVPTDSNAANNSVATTDNSTSATPAPNSTANTFPSAANSSGPAHDFPDDNALQSTYTTSYFTDANITTANSSNSLKPDLVSNTTVNASEGEMNGTDFGNDGYNWTSVTTQSSGGVGGGGGGNWSNSSVSTNSNSTEGNQTANMTTASYYKTILCYNCSGDNCSKTDDVNNNNTATCVSNTGTCYMQYDAVATALSYSCVPLLSGGGNGCPSAYATRVEKTVCEMCCTASLCNSKAPSEMEQMCHQQLRSSVDQIGGGGGGGGVFQLVVAALIAAIHYCTFATASCFGDW